MPRFFFDLLISNDEHIADDTGVELEDADLARAFAEGIASTFRHRGPTDPQRVIVRDETGRAISSIPASDDA